MASFCIDCGDKLPFWNKVSRNARCSECSATWDKKRRDELAAIEHSIMMTRECTPEQLQLLKTYAHTEMVSDFFHRLWQRFITSREFDERDLHTLRSIQQAAELSDRGVLEAQLAGIEYGIKATRRYTPQQLNLLLTYDYRTVRDFYERIYTHL